MMRLFVFVGAVVLVALLVTGNLGSGPLGPPKTALIAELLAEPQRWDGNPVRVSGMVGERVAVLGYGGFTLRDRQENEILIIGATMPAGIGQTVTADGRFLTAFAVGSVWLPVILVGSEWRAFSGSTRTETFATECGRAGPEGTFRFFAVRHARLVRRTPCAQAGRRSSTAREASPEDPNPSRPGDNVQNLSHICF